MASWSTAAPVDPLDEETTRLLKELDLAKEAELKRENLVLRQLHEKLAAKLETVKKQRDDLRAQNEEMGKTLSAHAREREATLQKLKDLGVALGLDWA